MQKFLFDLFPIILFFIAFKVYDIFIATAVAIVATLLQIIFVYLKDKKVEKVLLFNGVMITFLGGLTILLQDKMFIMWKPSVLYWCFALILLFSNLFLKKNLVQMALGKQVELKGKFWNQETSELENTELSLTRFSGGKEGMKVQFTVRSNNEFFTHIALDKEQIKNLVKELQENFDI